MPPTVERIAMTSEGYERMKDEFENLKGVERPKIIEEVETARAHGDLSENAEYHAAREKLGYIQGRLQELEVKLSKAEIIDPKSMKGQEKIMFSATVKLMDVETDKKSVYQLVGEYEADVNAGKISVTSPIARALIGKKEGDLVTVKTPGGAKEYEIEKVEYK